MTPAFPDRDRELGEVLRSQQRVRVVASVMYLLLVGIAIGVVYWLRLG